MCFNFFIRDDDSNDDDAHLELLCDLVNLVTHLPKEEHPAGAKASLECLLLTRN